jgi:hypothetical protein
MATQKTPGIQQALLFMPDITGFTEFVNSTEITHAQNIIQELLEIIIESNQLELKVGEIEGDAVFFYRTGSAPTMDQLLEQVKTMFTRFHQHLQLYDHQRICPCGACTGAIKLKLKVFAHFGNVTGVSIKEHHKLFGRDIIILHRLLKNSLNKKEYALFTEQLLQDAKPLLSPPSWYESEAATEHYDVGTINFTVTDLSRLHDEVPPITPPAYNLYKRAKVVFTEEKLIPFPMDQVFTPIFDLSQRSYWMDGVKKVEIEGPDQINRVGTLHRCIRNEKNNPIIVTNYAQLGSGTTELIEMDEKGTGGCRYHLEQTGENETMLKIDLLVKNHPIVLLFFNLTMKAKMRKGIVRSLNNLIEYCKQPRVTVREPQTAEK